MDIRRKVTTLLLLGLVLPVGVGRAHGQILTVTGTYQANLGRYDQRVPGSRFRAWGLMLGAERESHWWSPHIWIRRYEREFVQAGAGPNAREDLNTGWFVSVGPAIEFAHVGPVTGTILPQIGVSSQTRDALNGGGGLHVGFQVGIFRPQLFGRFQTLGGPYFWTVGAGVTMEITRRAASPDPF